MWFSDAHRWRQDGQARVLMVCNNKVVLPTPLGPTSQLTDRLS